MRWIMYTVSQSSMLAIKNNRENHLIINQIYDILAELHNQRKHIILCKVHVKGNEEADNAAKPEIDMPGMTTARLSHTYYYPNFMKARNPRVAKGIQY